jgi:hypothetical protein
MSLDNDAQEFGRHMKQGGWRLGLLVARNVEPGKPGRPAKRPPVDDLIADEPLEDDELSEDSEDVENQDKVSFSEFAAKAGVSKQHVANYYSAWQLAADDGKCQHAEQLSPGDEDLDDIEEDDEHTRELWSKFLQKAKEPKEPKSSGGSRGGAGGAKGSKPDKTPQAQVARTMEQVSDDTERLSGHLSQLTEKVSLGAKAVFAGLAQDLRETRAVLEKDCDRIDEILEFIASKELDVTDSTDVEAVRDDQDTPEDASDGRPEPLF